MNEKYAQHFRKNFWLYAAFAFFLAWKFFLVHALWEERSIPPVADDSLVYALHIDATLQCPNFISCTKNAINLDSFSGYDHLTYRLFLGSIAKLFGWDTFSSYQYGFYIGTLLLAFALLFFTTRLNPGKSHLAAYTLFLFALFNGSGAFHGFYWVVPSFFAFLFFIILAGFIVSDKKPFSWVLLGFVTILGIFTHILFLYSLIIFIFYFCFYSFFTKTFSRVLLQKILFILIVASCIYFPIEHYYQQQSIASPYGPLEVASSLLQPEIISSSSQVYQPRPLQLPDFQSLFIGWNNINNDYFRWIFHNFFGYMAFCGCFALLFYYQQYKILSLYFGSLFLTLFSTLNIHGERSLLFLWPLTFIYFGYGAWFLWITLHTNIHSLFWKRLNKSILVIVFLFFSFIALFYSFLWNTYLNQAGNYTLEPQLVTYLTHLPRNESIVYSEKAYFLELLLTISHPAANPSRSLELDTATYYLTMNKETIVQDLREQKFLFKDFFEIMNAVLAFNQKGRNNDLSYSEVPSSEDFIFVREKTFTDITLYRLVPKEY